MKNKKLWLVIVAIVVAAAAIIAGIFLLGKRKEEVASVSKNSKIFYENTLETVGADPDVIYITEGEDAGYYYMYITSDDIHGSGFLAYKSKDLVNWTCAGVALKSEGVYDEATGYTTISYAFSNYWAPEVIYDQDTKLYYMFYNANRYDTSFESGTNFYGDVAVSESPAGPFVQYNKYLGKEPVLVDEAKKILAYEPVYDFAKMPKEHPLYESEKDGYMKVIDMNPFVDPATGNKYMYFCHDLGKKEGVTESSIYVVALNDDYTAKYDEVYHLTSANRYELESEVARELNEGNTNEAPYVIYNEESGLYYLLYSANAYYQKTYSVRIAVSESPTGPFKKLSQEEGGFLLYADSHWTWASGTGHCSVVNKNGQDYIVYHAHQDRVSGNSLRGIAVDELNWTKNKKDILVPVVNGPSSTYMPLTTYLYGNVAPKAEIKASNLSNEGNTTLLNDKLIAHHDNAFIEEAKFNGNASTITLNFEEVQNVAGLAIYNSRDYDYMFSNVKKITLQLENGSKQVYKNLAFDWSKYYTEDGDVIPGGSIALEFEEIGVKSIEIQMPKMDTEYAISEIAVMAKRVDQKELPDMEEVDSWNVKAPKDDTVEFDGKVNPEEYTGEKISFADTNGVTMTMYSKMVEEGVFFGFHSNDSNVYVNNEQQIFQNTSVEIQLGKGGSENLNANVIQVRYGLDGSAEGWIGVNSAKNYEYMRTYIETVSKVHIYGKLNSSNCEGYDVEAFIPYSALNLEEKPDSLICAPSFNTRKDFDASGRTTWTLMVGSSFQDPTSWYRIDANGQTVMTDGFEVEEDKITQSGGSNQFYYFGDELSDAYYVNVDIKVKDILNKDKYPKFGVASKSLDSLLAYYFDIAGKEYNSIGRVTALTTEFSGTNWEWETNSSNTFGASGLGLFWDESVNVELIRYENQFAMLVNGRYVLGDMDVRCVEEGSIPGLFFFNTEAEVTVNAYVTEKEDVEEYIYPYLSEVKLDADLNDWNLDNTLIATEKDASNGNEMSVYAYRGEKGVYVAYDVVHQYQPKVHKWAGTWHLNTNAEFWIGDEHFACTSFGDSGHLVNSMKTTEDLVNGGYRTIMEVFVPDEVLSGEEDTLNVAFKTCDKEYKNISEITDNTMKFNNDPWWYFKGYVPTNQNNKFVIK